MTDDPKDELPCEISFLDLIDLIFHSQPLDETNQRRNTGGDDEQTPIEPDLAQPDVDS